MVSDGSVPRNFPVIDMNFLLNKLNKLLNKKSEIVSGSENLSEIEVVNEKIEARTTRAVEAKSNTIISSPSQFTVKLPASVPR